MRVLHIQKVAGIGGSERHLLELLHGLGSRGVECAMCVLTVGDWRQFTDAMTAKGIEWMTVRAGPDIDPTLPLRLWRVARQWKPDLLHTHLIHADIYGQVAGRMLNVPAVSSVHSSHDFYKGGPYQRGARLAGRLARCTIAISEHVADTLVSNQVVPADRVRVVRYGVDVGAWDADRFASRVVFGISDKEFVLGIASRLIENKGHEHLLRAFHAARPKLEESRLLVAGVGPLSKSLEELVRELTVADRVSFLGFVDDMPSFMAACDALVFPSFGEGFGLAALEAQATGRPVIAFGVDSLLEIIEHGRTGLLVEPGSVEGLAEAIVRLGSDAEMRKKMGEQARNRARAEFSLEKMVEGNLSVYEEVTAL